ncbi:MAG: molybdopterin guanine dinucleotide-containing S/N-oxide reductase [Rickettsiales bacterium]
MTDTLRRRQSSHWGAFSALVEGGRMTSVTPFEADENPSPLIQSMPDALYADCRVERPMIRKSWLEKGPGNGGELRGAEPFVAVSWDEASELVAAELDRVRKTFGNQAIFGGSYGWSSAGRFHHAKSQLQRFLGCIGGFTTSVNSYSNAAGQVILPHVMGGGASAGYGPYTSWDSIERDTELFVSFGGLGLKNTQIEPGGMGEHATHKWLPRLKAAGVEFISVTPCRDDTADYLNAEWWAPRPNSDVAIMLGLAHTLYTEDLHDQAFLDRYCVGFETFRAYLTGETDGLPKTAKWAASLSEIDPDAIRGLARKMAAKRTMIGTAYALQRGDHGEQPYWMTVTLAAMLGQIGLSGGGYGFGYGSMNGYGNPSLQVPSPALPTGENPIRDYIPVARIADLLLTPGGTYQYNGEDRIYPDIRLVYWCGGNPFHHHQDLNRLIEAWRRPETIIVNEPWWTSTARFADIVLPATTTMERNDIGASSRDRFWLAMQQVVEPVGEARNDFDIFSDIALRLGVAEAFTEGRDEDTWLRHLYDVARQQAARRRIEMPDFDSFWEKGYAESPAPEEPYVLFSDFRSDPEKHPRDTPSGKIEIFSETIHGFGYEDCPGHATWMEPSEWLGSEAATRFPLHMVSNQPNTRLHGQLDPGRVSRDSKISGREPVRLNPKDAAARAIADGDIVRIYNDRGAILAGAVLTEAVRPGVIDISTGAWYDPLEPGRIGTLDRHGNPNVLTLDKGTSKLAQGPTAHSSLVEIEKFDGALPEITVFSQPQTA